MSDILTAKEMREIVKKMRSKKAYDLDGPWSYWCVGCQRMISKPPEGGQHAENCEVAKDMMK